MLQVSKMKVKKVLTKIMTSADGILTVNLFQASFAFHERPVI